jgi:hypothetical protein
VANFVDYDELRKRHVYKAKQGYLDKPWGATSSRKPSEADPAAKKHHKVKSTPVKIEIAEWQNASDKVGFDSIALEK